MKEKQKNWKNIKQKMKNANILLIKFPKGDRENYGDM